MRTRIFAAVATALALAAGPVQAHDVPNMDHTHAFQQQSYGKFRQGHSVNNEYGSITIWSPRTYTGYQTPPAVRFARPEPISRPPGTPGLQKRTEQNPARDYGEQTNPDYGD